MLPQCTSQSAGTVSRYHRKQGADTTADLWELDYDAATLNADLSANRVVHRTREPLRALNEVLQGIRADWSDNSYDSDA